MRRSRVALSVVIAVLGIAMSGLASANSPAEMAIDIAAPSPCEIHPADFLDLFDEASDWGNTGSDSAGELDSAATDQDDSWDDSYEYVYDEQDGSDAAQTDTEQIDTEQTDTEQTDTKQIDTEQQTNTEQTDADDDLQATEDWQSGPEDEDAVQTGDVDDEPEWDYGNHGEEEEEHVQQQNDDPQYNDPQYNDPQYNDPQYNDPQYNDEQYGHDYGNQYDYYDYDDDAGDNEHPAADGTENVDTENVDTENTADTENVDPQNTDTEPVDTEPVDTGDDDDEYYDSWDEESDSWDDEPGSWDDEPSDVTDEEGEDWEYDQDWPSDFGEWPAHGESAEEDSLEGEEPATDHAEPWEVPSVSSPGPVFGAVVSLAARSLDRLGTAICHLSRRLEGLK